MFFWFRPRGAYALPLRRRRSSCGRDAACRTGAGAGAGAGRGAVKSWRGRLPPRSGAVGICARTGREGVWTGAGSAEVPMARYSRAVIVWNFVWSG